jgi:hypothetical protein
MSLYEPEINKHPPIGLGVNLKYEVEFSASVEPMHAHQAVVFA